MLLRLIGICSLVALPAALEAKESTVSHPAPDVIWMKFDEYGGISSKKEKFRLKNFVIELREWKTSNAFIVAHAGRRSCKGEAQARANRVKQYLIRSGGVEASRISTIDAGYQEDWSIELYVAPREAPPLTLADIQGGRAELRADQLQIRG
jgi:hypothetical protein